MEDSNKSRSEAQERSNRSEPEWVTRILEVYERIKKENDQRENLKVRS